jgi:hypothetical protein
MAEAHAGAGSKMRDGAGSKMRDSGEAGDSDVRALCAQGSREAESSPPRLSVRA